MGSKLHNRIKTWKKLLLDFGKRNRLINFKDGKRSNVEIVMPSYKPLYDLIAVHEKEVIFPYAGKVRVNENGEEVYNAVIEGNVETTKTVGELQKTLKMLRYRANTSIEEQGINTLYLAFGLLKWTEREDSSQTFASPLILVPVKLTIDSLTSPYKLLLHEDEIVVNPTLTYKLDNDFSIKIPGFDNTQDDIESYFEHVEKMIAKRGWSVDRCVNLTNLSFLKINMYKDLENNKEKLQANPIISAIAGEHEPISFPAELNNYDHDTNTRPIDIFQVVDADSSQQDAILLSKAGKSFVLQGPPGTGKSQTITNIISEALADGKKVLFVSEKMAALQVVYKRLANVGLADFCFTLHSHKVSKKEILNELANAIAIDRKRVREEALVRLDMLERKRSILNDYQKELHTPCSALNNTIFNINGRLAKLDDVPEYIFEITDVENTTELQLGEKIYLLSELAKTIDNNNVWKDATIPYLSNELRHDIDAKINSIVAILPDIEKDLLVCSQELGISITPSLSGLDFAMELLRIAAKSPLTLKKWVYQDDFEELESKLAEHRELCESYVVQKTTILKEFDREILGLDYYPILQRFRSDYNTFMRKLKSGYRKDIQLLNRFSSTGAKLDYNEAIELLNNIKSYHEKLDCVLSQEGIMKTLYEGYYCDENTDWGEINDSVEFAKELRGFISRFSMPEILVEKICGDNSTIAYCKNSLLSLTVLYDSIHSQLEWFFSLFDNVESFKDCGIGELTTRLSECKDKKHLLEKWVDYRANKEKCNAAGLTSYLQQIEENVIDANLIVNVYLKRFYRLWLDSVLLKFPAVQNFRGRIQEQVIGEFCQLDKEQFVIAQARVRERVVARMPDFNTITSTRDEIGILKRELNKRRRLMPLRKLFMAIPNLVTALKPCFMMSPLSVSVFLEAKSYDFDLVIFDEASQVHTEDAIGAIMRGKQVIIVGDAKQLPPTNFFAVSLNDEEYDIDTNDEEQDNDAGAFDSILDEALAVLPERSLRWHYRSRHEHLIAFSNAKIYNHSLITFPSIIDKSPNFGVEYIYVADGVYDRGGKKNNLAEAKRVADLVFEHFQNFPERSLGVVTFSEAQQAAVDMAIRQKRHENDAFESFFVEDKEEAFFIKNLENVQGDECDTIIFSIGYAKDNRGIMYMNFGPLSRDGGYRRLNVAITRAKYNVKLVGSIMPIDIDVAKVESEGVKMLRSYIEFAQQGVVALQKELSYSDLPVFDSPFEESVYDFLTSKKYEIVTQVGCSGFRIDMAIKNPQRRGEFAIGIECDGATYHSSRTARERDRLRQTILEDMGWVIYRIWSTDWIKNPEIEKEKLIQVVEKALCKINIDKLSDSNVLEAVSCLDVEEEVEEKEMVNSDSKGFSNYVYADINVLEELPVTRAIKRVVEIEQPIHLEELCRRVAPLYGRQKVTSSVVDEVTYQIKKQLTNDVQIGKDLFVTIRNFNTPVARKTLDAPRKIEYISQSELVEALRIVIGHSFGITPNDLFLVTARNLGYKRTSVNIISSIEKAYKTMLRKGMVKEIEGKVSLIND